MKMKMKIVKLHSLDYLKEHYNCNDIDGIKNENNDEDFMIVRDMFPLFENEAIIKIIENNKNTTVGEIYNTNINKNKALRDDLLGWGIDEWMIEKEISPEDYPEYFI